MRPLEREHSEHAEGEWDLIFIDFNCSKNIPFKDEQSKAYSKNLKPILHHQFHHHLFLKRLFLHRSAKVRRLPRYEASPHNPEHCPFRLQTKLLTVTFYTLQVSLCLYTFRPTSPHFYRPYSSYKNSSKYPNHLNLPLLTTSAKLWTPKRLYKTSLGFLSETLHTSTSPS